METERSKAQFAAKCALAPSVLENYLSARSLPGLEILLKICEAAGVSIEWMATGEGPRTPPHYGVPRSFEPVQDKRLASLIAWIVETWEAATEFDRGAWYAQIRGGVPRG